MHTQFHNQDRTSAARCAASNRDGSPCQGPALPNSPFCAFHDPRHHEAIAAGRARGGAAPRRRVRRLPRRLDYLQIADLTGELFVEALNHADPADPRSLRAVGQLARILLQAVGRPKDRYVEPGDGEEPAADAPHLLRVYPPASLAMETFLAADGTQFRAATGEDYFAPTEEYFAPMEEEYFAPAPPAPAPPGPGRPARLPAPESPGYVDYHFQPDPSAGPCEAPTAARLDSSEQGAGQGVDREWTGHLATENVMASDQPSHPAPSPADPATVPAADPAFTLPRSLVYIRPRPRDPFG
jgi:hypothetical protein